MAPIEAPGLKPADRLSLLLLAKVTRTWRQALLIVQPATLLRWHREGYRLFWKWRSRKRKSQPRISEEMIALSQTGRFISWMPGCFTLVTPL